MHEMKREREGGSETRPEREADSTPREWANPPVGRAESSSCHSAQSGGREGEGEEEEGEGRGGAGSCALMVGSRFVAYCCCCCSLVVSHLKRCC